MTITATDVKLLKSERMTDTTDGGGRRTSNIVVDGVAGNIFPKVSRLDSVYGRVNLRKVFGSVQTANVDTYAGAHAVITDAPDNDKIHATLFSTGSDFDDRTAARDRIESYVIAGPESRMVLYGRQLLGQMAVLAYQRVEDTLPEVGEVFCLSEEAGSVITFQQYVRVTNVAHEVRIMADLIGDFTRRVVTLTIGSPLRHEFSGPDTPSRLVNVPRATLIRRTSVADASRYVGIRPLAAVAPANALEIEVDSVYAPIVPTTERETPVANAELAGAVSLKAAAVTPLPFTRVGPDLGVNINGAQIITARAPSAIYPGSFQAYVQQGFGSSPGPGTTVVDDGKGNIVAPTVPSVGRQINGGTINYDTGELTINVTWANGLITGAVFVSYRVATETSQPAHSRNLPVTVGTRGTVYVETLLPIPAPNTVFLEFRALGKWYRLRDDGKGVLAGDDPAYGTGTIDYTTGSAVITLGALPDVGSEVLFAWGSTTHYLVRAGATSDGGTTVDQRFTLPNTPVKPGSLSITYTSGVTVNTATDAAGVISGGNTAGTVNYATGEVLLQFTSKLPNMGTSVNVAYVQQVPSTVTPTVTSGTVPVTDPTNILLGTAVQARGLKIGLIATLSGQTCTVYALDDGSGVLKTLPQSFGQAIFVPGGQAVGTVNYATGAVAATPPHFTYTAYYGSSGSGAYIGWQQTNVAGALQLGEYPYTLRTGAAATDTARTLVVDPQGSDAPAFLDLTRTVSHAVVPGSVMFTAFGRLHFDRNGVLYSDLLTNGSATARGTIDYATGEVRLTSWVDNTTITLSVQACLTVFGDWTTVNASFRTAGSPIRSASLFVQATSTTGDVLTATCDEGGVLTGTKARGNINQAMGSAFIEWGQMVTAAGNEAEQWYDAANVVGGLIWKPQAVFPGSIRYNCVVLSNLPLNADILGLDPVRLPSDGRVPIYRPADVVVIHNTKSYALPNPAVASATYNVGRTALSELWLIDAAGARVSTASYIVDLAAGTVTMAADLNLTGIPQPLVARHRIEELNLLSDVQINGQLSLTGPLSREFDTDTFVSSALLFGDMFARVTNLFDQVTFTSGWADVRNGADAPATYNSVDFPVLVQNDGAITERWRINFTTATAFQVIGEVLGVIATGTTAADIAPVNALTGKPYFNLRAAGWGAGWSVGNNLRFNTVGASAPIWIARTVLPGATLSGDSLDLQLRGDVDA